MFKRLIFRVVTWQSRFAVLFCLVALLLGYVSYPRATHLLKSVATDLIHLLPNDYASVRYTEEIQKKFNRRSSLFLILNSPDPQLNEQVLFDLKAYLEKYSEVGEVLVEKRGYKFFDNHKLLLVDIEDLYKIHDRLKEKIQKEKLGGLYIDLEEGDKSSEVTFDDLIKNYKEKFAEGVQSRYRRNEDGTVYVLDIYPKSTDSGLKFFKHFGEGIDTYVKKYDFSRYPQKIDYGYAGAIKTRVDQYDALINDLKRAGLFSGVSIFAVLYIYFSLFIHPRRRGLWQRAGIVLLRVVPVVIIFIPMMIATLAAFAFNSLFFDKLNVVTSFLFAIIFGLGVDIGIHLLSRYIQDRGQGLSIEKSHQNIIFYTGKSAATSILTTVASFYIMTFTDFRGFSDFGWIAGNGLVIALLIYLIFFPSFIVLADRLGLLVFAPTSTEPRLHTRRRWLPYLKPVLAGFVIVSLVSVYLATCIEFEWNFKELSMKIPEREAWKEKLKETLGRVNSPAVYLVENAEQARTIAREIKKRAKGDPTPTVHFFRSYYDMIPADQDEKLALLAKIDVMLADDAMNSLKDDEKKLLRDFREEIARTRRITEKDVDADIHELFWGNTGLTDKSVAYIMPLPELHLGDGRMAMDFYNDVYRVDTPEKSFYAVSDAMVFADVLRTLFRDSKIVVTLASLVLVALTAIHFRRVREVALITGTLACGILWMLALLPVFGLKLNFYNMIVIPAMIGMGEDNSVHMIDRFEELGKNSIVGALRTSGGAAFMASLTTMLGYAGLCLAHHPGLNSIGLMSIIGMGTCLVGSLVLLPFLLQLTVRKS